jgi:two-component system, OmpR family, sensor histidine kinase BaeS
VGVSSRDDVGRLAEALNGMSQRLAEQEQERSAFLATASHELRTPVSNIRATLEALQAGGDALQVRRARFLKGALGEAVRLGHLVEDLMDLAHLEAWAAPLRAGELRLRSVLDKTLAAADVRLREKQIRVRVAMSPGVRVWGEACRLQQVLTNVIENAIRYSPRGGEIAVTAALEDDQVSIDIVDQGPGIPAEALPRVFERFFTADPSRSRRHGGSGLGLYIARKIVETHGGSVTAANSSAGGASLTLRLPLAGGAPSLPPP